MKKIIFLLSLIVLLATNSFGQGRGTDFYHNAMPTWYTDLDTVAENTSDTVYTTCDKFADLINYHTVGFQVSYSVLTGVSTDQYHIQIFGSKNGTDYVLLNGDITTILASDFQTSPTIYCYNYEIGNPGFFEDNSGGRNSAYVKFMIIFKSSSSGLSFNWRTYMLIR